MKNLKTVVISIPVLLIGGTEIQTLNLVKVLSDAGYQVIVLCYYEYKNEIVESMEEAGAEVQLMKLQRSDGMFSLVTKLISEFKKLSPSIVHVQYISPGFIPIIAAKFAGVKRVIATVHQPGRTYGWKEKAMLRFGSKLCSLFLCVSKSVEDSWFGDSEVFDPSMAELKRKHYTIYNFVDTEKIAKASSSENVNPLRISMNLENKKVVGFIGRLRCEKGPSVLVEAMEKVIKKIPEAVLLVVGDGPDRSALEDQARELKIHNHILWLGQKTQQEVFQLYGLINIVAMPSYFEGFGLTAAEAMAAGIPVIGSNIDGLSEVITNQKTGVLVNTGDSDEFACAIISLLEYPETLKQMSIVCLQNVKKYFSINGNYGHILAVYSLVLRG